MENIEYQFGVMSSKYSLQAKNKLTAYATMCVFYNDSAHLVVVYSPEECREDSWTTFTGGISERLDEIFGGKNSFEKYLHDNIMEIKECSNSIKQII